MEEQQQPPVVDPWQARQELQGERDAIAEIEVMGYADDEVAMHYTVALARLDARIQEHTEEIERREEEIRQRELEDLFARAEGALKALNQLDTLVRAAGSVVALTDIASTRQRRVNQASQALQGLAERRTQDPRLEGLMLSATAIGIIAANTAIEAPMAESADTVSPPEGHVSQALPFDATKSRSDTEPLDDVALDESGIDNESSLTEDFEDRPDPQELQIDIFLPLELAATFAALLRSHEAALQAKGIPLIDTDVVLALVDALEHEQISPERPDVSNLRQIREQAIVQAARLIADAELLVNVAGELPSTDPRHGLIDYLSHPDTLNANTFEDFLDLLDLTHDQEVVIQTPHRSGPQVLRLVRYNPEVETRHHAVADAAPRSEISTSDLTEESPAEGIAVVVHPLSAAEQTEVVDSFGDTLPLATPERRRRRIPAEHETHVAVGEVLDKLIASGMGIQGTLKIGLLRTKLHSKISQKIGAASNRGLLLGDAVAGVGEIEVIDVVMAMMTEHSKRPIQAYATKKPKDLRGFIERAIEQRVAQAAAQQANYPQTSN